MVEYSPEQLGQMLAAIGKSTKAIESCEHNTKRLETKIGTLETKIDALVGAQRADDELRARAATIVGLVKWGGLTVIGLLVTFGAWLVMQQRDHDVRVSSAEVRIVALTDADERDGRAREQMRTEVTSLRSDTRAIAATLERVATQLDRVDERVQRIPTNGRR